MPSHGRNCRLIAHLYHEHRELKLVVQHGLLENGVECLCLRLNPRSEKGRRTVEVVHARLFCMTGHLPRLEERFERGSADASTRTEKKHEKGEGFKKSIVLLPLRLVVRLVSVTARERLLKLLHINRVRIAVNKCRTEMSAKSSPFQHRRMGYRWQPVLSIQLGSYDKSWS